MGPDGNDPRNGAPDGGRTHAKGPEGDRWLRSVVEHSSEIIKVLDLDGTLRYASPAFGRVLGYDPDEAVGTNVLDYVHPDDLPYVLKETEKALAEAGVATNMAEYRALGVDGRVSYWNQAAEEMYGWSAQEAMGRRLKEMVVPEHLRSRAGEIMARVREGSTWKGEFVVQRRDGTLFQVEATNTPIFGEDDGLVGVIGVLKDVTERKEAEEALRKSEAELFSVLESITDSFFALDRELRFTYVNSQAEVLFSRAREELIGER